MNRDNPKPTRNAGGTTKRLPPGVKSWEIGEDEKGNKQLKTSDQDNTYSCFSNSSATVEHYEGNWLIEEMINVQSYCEQEAEERYNPVPPSELQARFKILAKYYNAAEIEMIARCFPGEINDIRKQVIDRIAKITRRDPATVRKNMQPSAKGIRGKSY